MAFSEHLKLQVKRNAAFRCCRCHELGIDVHHVVPKSKGGHDNLDNAAPLCQNCHDRFGDNAQKRKEIRQMRDWWYEIVTERFGSSSQFTMQISQLGNDIKSYIRQHEALFVNLSRSFSPGEKAAKLSLLDTVDDKNATKFITVDRVKDPSAFAIEIRGSSMLPRFHSGDLVVVSPKARTKSGDACIVRVEGHDTLKIIEFEGNLLHLIPTNQEFEPITVKRSSVEFIYKVVKLIADL